jgi:serine/threonine protein kinase
MPMKTEYASDMSRTSAYESPSVVSLRVLSGVARAAPLLGRVVAGRYHVDGVLGRGTTSMVFKASQVDGGPPVALKVLSPVNSDLVDHTIADRFRFEAHVLSSVHHPNVVSMSDCGATDDGLLFTVMELLEGETLAARLAAQQRLESDEAARIAFDIAEGLHALHERKLLHRDVKPANVFLARTAEGGEVVKLMDLGLARTIGSGTAPQATPGSPGPGTNESEAADDGPRRRMNTQEGLVLGTGPYMSPELIEGRALDARSDVYALGVVTYRMLTGTLPFRGRDLPDVLSQHVSEPVEPPSERAPSAGLSKALDAVLLRALEKDPDFRPATARDFADELRAALRERDGPPAPAMDVATPPPAFPSGPTPEMLAARRRVARWGAAAVLGFAALLAGYAVASRARHAGPIRDMPSPVAVLEPYAPAKPAEASTLPAKPPTWELEVGSAVVEHASRKQGKPARRTSAPRPVGTTAPAEQRMPTEPDRRAAFDDLKVPPWRSRASR